MSERTRERLDEFWELVDEFLNAVLFVVIGLEVGVLPFEAGRLQAALLLIPGVLAARFLAVLVPAHALRPRHPVDARALQILTWGGLRGGISVALALSLPPGAERDLLLPVTYAIVCFSIVVQGLSIGPLIQRLYAAKT
jgi:CPA1 family monovalent cation:H+ antiporter